MTKKITTDAPNQLALSDFDFSDEEGTVVSVNTKLQTGKDITLTVAQFLDSINELISPLETIVQGEISSLQERGSAVYFTLSDKDEKAVLNCLIWKNKARALGFELKEGMEVKVSGHPNIYKPFGKFSLQADYVSPVGEGALKQALERLMQQLRNDGYFALERKRPLPRFPRTIGLISSEFGDAKKDFLTHLGQHGHRILFYDVRVEGVQSIASIVQAIRWFNEQTNDVELLILTRGGGSLESLQAFNSLEVAQAIFGSRIPVLSAVGHENDTSVSDLVADVRASTPTHAGRMLAEQWTAAQQQLTGVEQVLLGRYQALLRDLNTRLSMCEETMLRSYESRLQEIDTQLRQYETILRLVDPDERLRQGYAIVFDSKNQLVRRRTDVPAGEKISIQLHNDQLHAEVR
ncbi:MAG: exodeoxyribonuclease VII large subunit [Patescibacteria group bacterium]